MVRLYPSRRVFGPIFASFCSTLFLLVLGGFASVCGAPENVPDIVFVSRDIQGSALSGPIARAADGRLMVRHSDGSLKTLVDPAAVGTPIADVLDPDVSYDGQRIVFAGFSNSEAAWRIFEINADGSDVRQITHSDRSVDLTVYGESAAKELEDYDDGDPCYLPDGRICFVSTRYPGIAPDNRLRSTNLYVVYPDGSDLHRITTERFGADTPTVEPATGRIVYSRWWRSGEVGLDSGQEVEPIDAGSPDYGGETTSNGSGLVMATLPLRDIPSDEFPGINSWFLSGVNPDGTGLTMFSGFRLDRELTQAYRPDFLPDGQVLALFIPETPIIGSPGANGMRVYEEGMRRPQAAGGPQTFDDELSANGEQVQRGFVYASAEALADGRVLVTGAAKTPRDYGIYVQEQIDLAPVLLYSDPLRAEQDAVALVARQRPPVIADRSDERLPPTSPRTVEEAFTIGGSFTFTVENIHFNAPVDVPMANAPPVGEPLAIEFYMNPQLTSLTGVTDPPILIRREEIPPSGRVSVELPGGVPLFEVLRRNNGNIARGRDGQIFHVGGRNFSKRGEDARCVGCHAGHSRLEVPEEFAWTNVAPSAVVHSTSPTIRRSRNVNLIDRSTAPLDSEWAVVPDGSVRVQLVWKSPIQGKEVVFYGIAKGPGKFGDRNQVIRSAVVETVLSGIAAPKESVLVNEINEAGTVVPLDAAIRFDSMRITIDPDQVSGLYEGDKTIVALAEIEVIGRSSPMEFLRGDADCSGVLAMADVTTGFMHLFSGKTRCCEAAADTNGDGIENLSDPIYLLAFMFLGETPPPPPFPNCGYPTTQDASCDQGSCF